jgi:hypothetical protein
MPFNFARRMVLPRRMWCCSGRGYLTVSRFRLRPRLSEPMERRRGLGSTRKYWDENPARRLGIDRRCRNSSSKLRPLNPEHHLTPGPLPHFVAEREMEAMGSFERSKMWSIQLSTSNIRHLTPNGEGWFSWLVRLFSPQRAAGEKLVRHRREFFAHPLDR